MHNQTSTGLWSGNCARPHDHPCSLSRMPADFEAAAKAAVTSFVSKYGEELLVDEIDLSILRDDAAPGSWLIWHSHTGTTYPLSVYPEALVSLPYSGDAPPNIAFHDFARAADVR